MNAFSSEAVTPSCSAAQAHSDPADLLRVLLNSWMLDPIASVRLATSCIKASAADPKSRKALARVHVSREGRVAWQQIVDWYLRTVGGSGFGSAASDREAGQIFLGLVTAIRDCIVETLSKVSHGNYVNIFRRRSVALPLVAAARAVRCVVELSLVTGRPDILMTFLVLDWLLDRACVRGVAGHVDRRGTPEWRTSVNAEAGMSSLLAKVESIDLSTAAVASLLLALRTLSTRCIATQRPVDGIQFAVFFERGGASFRPYRAGRMDPVSLYVGNGDLVAMLGDLLDSPDFLTWCEPDARPEIRALLMRHLAKVWGEGDEGRAYPRMQMRSPIHIAFGLQQALDIKAGDERDGLNNEASIAAIMRDLSKHGAEVVLDNEPPDLETGSFCVVSLEGERNWYGGVVRRHLPGRWSRDGKGVIGIEWVEGYLKPVLLGSEAPSVLPFDIGWVEQKAEKMKFHRVFVTGESHLGARAIRAVIAPAGAFAIGEPVQLKDGDVTKRYRVMTLICQMKQADWLRLVEWGA